jgi:hypothetical protein
MSQYLDIIMSHDWPAEVDQHGDFNSLVSKLPYVASIKTESCYDYMALMKQLKPQKWYFDL